MQKLALALLALILLIPSTLAHGGELGVFRGEGEGLAVFLNTDGVMVVKAQRPITFNGSVVTNVNGKFETLSDAAVSIEVTGPGAMDVEIGRRTGGFVVNATFPAPGEWSFLVTTEGVLRRVPISVYPPTHVYMEASNLRTNYHYAQQPMNARLFFLEDATGVVVAPTQPATGRLSRLVNDTPVETEEVALPLGPLGSVDFSRTFDAPGSYVLTVASEELGLTHASLPDVHFDVKPPLATAAGAAGRAEANALGVLAILALTAALALARRK